MGDMADDYDLYGPDPYDDDEQELMVLKILELKAETGKAYLVVTEDFHEWWLPKSQCNYVKEDKVMEIPGWLLDKKMEEEP